MSRVSGASGAEWRSTRRAVLNGACAALAALSMRGEHRVTAAQAPDERFAEPDWLVDPAWLARSFGKSNTKVVAVTTPQDYETAHIPGARLIDWSELMVTDTPEATIETWRQPVEALLTERGLSPSDTIVLYDGGSFFSARLWWILEQLGHANKRILDGGLNAWISGGQPVETGSGGIVPSAVKYMGQSARSDIANLDMVASALDDSDVALIDTRPPGEYEQGHIPGAINIDHTTYASPPDSTAGQAAEYLRSLYAGVPASGEHRWPSTESLRAMYDEAGAPASKRVIAYGATGVRAALAYFNLRLIGYQDVWVYLGSWHEWSSHPELSVAIGRHP